MGKLNFLLSEDYIKPKIYFQPKLETPFKDSYSIIDRNHFEGLEHLTSLLQSPKGFIVNAFHVDYYQTLPYLIAKTIRDNRSYKKVYVIGPELSLSILKRSSKTVYEKHAPDFEYISIEQDHEIILCQCISLMKDGHILYMLPETSVCWQPELFKQFENKVYPLCSTLLSQEANVPILSSSFSENEDKVILHVPSFPQEYLGELEIRVEQQSETIYALIESNASD